MKLRIVCFAVWNLLLIVVVVILMRSCFAPDPVVLIKKEIQYNTVYKNTNSMTIDELRSELECFYKTPPELDIKQGGGADYVLSAGLCQRKWQRVVTITPRAYRNIVIVGGSVSSKMEPGGSVQYYRLFGKFGAGGGCGLSRDGPSFVQAGILYMW